MVKYSFNEHWCDRDSGGAGYSVERVRECIEELIEGRWIEKVGRFVTSLIDSYPA